MKKKLVIAALIATSTLMVGCNKQIIDTTWKIDRAIIVIGNEKIEVEVESWNDYTDTTVQIKDKNGKVYLTDIKNVLMMKE